MSDPIGYMIQPGVRVRLAEKWLQRAKALDLPKRGKTRDAAALHFLAGACSLFETDDDVPNALRGLIMDVSFRGSHVLDDIANGSEI